MNRKLLLGWLLILPFLLPAQTGFKYQAVVRDNAGNILSNQSVGFRLGIIQTNINNAPVYTETHTATTNAYGVVNLNVGQGTVVTGNFSGIDWSLASFLKIEMDVSGGTNYTDFGTSELLNVPRAMYAETAGSLTHAFGLNVKDYGAKGDNSTDDYTAFQNALTAAATNGNRVIVPAGNYKITQTLVIPDGVTLVGEGVGQEPLQTPFNGSAIRYSGTGAAIEISGHTSGVRDILIYDTNQGSTNADGILVKADGETVESVRLFNVLIHYFTGGTALHLQAINSGGIAYLTAYNVRIRHAKTGIHISEDATSFVNSNVFHHGAISGGGFDYCLLVDGGNNNQFYGTIFEPGASTYGHIVVNDGEIQGMEIRIEGNSQPATTPLVEFKTGTRNSTLTGTYAGGLTVDNGNNYIGFRSGKAAWYKNARNNLFENATFHGFQNNALPYWDITGTGVTATIQSPELTPHHNVLKLTVPAGVTANLEAASAYIPATKNLPLYGQMNIGMYVKTSVAGICYLRTNAPAGVVTSHPHPGDGNWHFVSMTQLVNTATTLDARLEINNTSGSPVDVYISTPTLNFGNQSPEIEPKPVTSAGGIITGTLSLSVIEFNNTTNNIVLPKEGNTFILTGTTTISRINDSTADRFPKGTVITLLFDNAGVSVTNGAYIQLTASFQSTANASLTLLSLGDGTWRELNRNL
ncbi:MAG: hypothetical protein D6714_16745 [Bacteroidetes bacterium]|nr:MAG: hypothetical protein D6714_16745 [Bacteroidota bacterium]